VRALFVGQGVDAAVTGCCGVSRARHGDLL
jgi:hypothetical protein